MLFRSLFKWIPAILLIVVACRESQPATPPASAMLPSKPATPLTAPEGLRNANIDKSPMDIIYFPADYPVLKMSGKVKDPPVARVIYSRPFKDGRKVFGNVIRLGAYWRLGANEGTEIEFFREVTIQGTRIKKGRYIIYCIPFADKWTIRLNGDLYTWGLSIHASEDLYSFDIPVDTSSRVFELFTMEFRPTASGANLFMAWDDVEAALPIQL